MKQIHIGEVIKQRRIELGLTQGELCEGICEIPTMSRIENGKQTPSRSKLNAILSRLGLPGEKYYAVMSENELEIEQLKAEIISYNMRRLCKEGLDKIEALSAITDQSDHITLQFILRTRAHMGKLVDGQVVQYTSQEKLAMLYSAIRLTIPNFDIEALNRPLYTLDELKIINQIAVTYRNCDQIERSIAIYNQLMEYLDRRFIITNDNVSIAILVAYNYSMYLTFVKRYAEATEIANLGWKWSIEWGRINHMGGLLYVLAESAYHTGDPEKSKEYYYHSYYAFSLMKNTKDAQIMKENIEEYFGGFII